MKLGIISIGLAVLGYLDQEIRCGTSWDWSQFWHHESLIAIAFCVGVVLLIRSRRI